MSKTIQIPATLEGVATLKDGGVTVRLHTQELTANEKAVVFDYQGKFGHFLFKESEFTQDDIKELTDIRKDTGGKSPSQRLRSSLYVLYTQTDTADSFEQFYAHKMEGIIDQVKERLK